MIEDGIIVNDVKKSENITISKYSGTMNFKYIKEKNGNEVSTNFKEKLKRRKIKTGIIQLNI